MLFRRLSRHVEDQNWFAVGIDFCIVVIGILIAFQITEWNEARSDTMRQKEILTDLLDDLQADKGSLFVSSELASFGIDAGNMLLVSAGLEPVKSVSIPGQSTVFRSNELKVVAPSQPSDDIRGELWKHASVRLYPSHNNGTIEALVVADNSSILKNKSLVRDLLRYRTLWTGLEGAQDNTFRPFRDRMIFVGQEHGLSPLAPTDYQVIADAIRTDPEMRGTLRTMVEYTIAHKELFDRLQQEAEALTARVEAELNP